MPRMGFYSVQSACHLSCASPLWCEQTRWDYCSLMMSCYLSMLPLFKYHHSLPSKSNIVSIRFLLKVHYPPPSSQTVNMKVGGIRVVDHTLQGNLENKAYLQGLADEGMFNTRDNFHWLLIFKNRSYAMYIPLEKERTLMNLRKIGIPIWLGRIKSLGSLKECLMSCINVPLCKKKLSKINVTFWPQSDQNHLMLPFTEKVSRHEPTMSLDKILTSQDSITASCCWEVYLTEDPH